MTGIKRPKEHEKVKLKARLSNVKNDALAAPPTNEAEVEVSNEVSSNVNSDPVQEVTENVTDEKGKIAKKENIEKLRKKRKSKKKVKGRKAKPKTTRKCKCNKACCKSCCKKICPYFPGCCDLPLQNCLQLLAVTDIIITLINIGIWVYFHQYDPFTHNVLTRLNRTDFGSSTSSSVGGSSTSERSEIADFHESTTEFYGKELGKFVDVQGDGVKFSKIGYVCRQYQQEVENMCGRDYYTNFLLGHHLSITNGVFTDLLLLTYFSEFAYQFIDISILVTTCCFFDYTSGRLYLIVVWNMELAPLLAKIQIIVESRSRRLCILQYGLGKSFRGLDALLFLHIIPMILFRVYKLIVFTYFVSSMLELGNLEHQTRIQGVTLQAYVERHDEYLRMDKNREKSSSEDDEIDNV